MLEILSAFDLLDEADTEAASKLRRSAESRAVQLPGAHVPCDESVAMLAAGFSRGEPRKLAVPYARLES